jgi:hypothetical protein
MSCFGCGRVQESCGCIPGRRTRRQLQGPSSSTVQSQQGSGSIEMVQVTATHATATQNAPVQAARIPRGRSTRPQAVSPSAAARSEGALGASQGGTSSQKAGSPANVIERERDPHAAQAGVLGRTWPTRTEAGANLRLLAAGQSSRRGPFGVPRDTPPIVGHSLAPELNLVTTPHPIELPPINFRITLRVMIAPKNSRDSRPSLEAFAENLTENYNMLVPSQHPRMENTRGLIGPRDEEWGLVTTRPFRTNVSPAASSGCELYSVRYSKTYLNRSLRKCCRVFLANLTLFHRTARSLLELAKRH